MSNPQSSFLVRQPAHRVSAEGLNAEAWNNTWAGVFFLCVILISLVLVLLLVGVVFSMYTFINLTKRSGRRLSSLKQVGAWVGRHDRFARRRAGGRAGGVVVASCKRWLANGPMDPRRVFGRSGRRSAAEEAVVFNVFA